MNAVEIEEAISVLAEQPFDAAEFPFAFLEAFGNKATTIKRLRSGSSNKSDLGGVLQTNNIHIAVCPEGEVTKTLTALKASPATTKAKAKFVLATDGIDLEAEYLNSGETVASAMLMADGTVNVPTEEFRAARIAQDDERAVASSALAAVRSHLGLDRALLQARIDLVRDDNGNPRVLEMDISEPSLNLPLSEGSARRLAQSLKKLIVS